MSEKEMRPGHDEPMPEGEEHAPPGVHAAAIVRWLLVGLMALAAVASVLYVTGVFERLGSSQRPAETVYYCPMHPSVVQDQPGECPICGMNLVPREGEESASAGAQYACPMHPEVTSSDPDDRCPKCGMKLEPTGHAGHSDVPGLAPLEIKSDRVQLMGMRTAKVERAQLASELRTVGMLTASEGGLANISTRFAGWIEELKVNETGQKVSRGQVLATVYSPELLTAQQELLNASRWAASAEEPKGGHGLVADLAGDARRRLELLGISPDEIEELERTRRPVRALRIRSPVDGYVTRRNAVQGLYVQPGTQLFEVADLSTIWVLAEIYEHEVRRIAVGQRADLTLASFPGELFPGRVSFLYPTVDPATRTLRARLEFNNPRLRLRPGMYGEVLIRLLADEGLVVPAEAVVDTGELQYVFLAREGGRFEPRKVKVGARSGDKVQLLEGVAEGEVVVTTANFLLDSESRLRAAISGGAGGEGDAAAPGHAGHGR